MAYEGLTDAEVLERAARALRKVQEHPVGSAARAIQWGIYESCAAELDRRAVAHALARLAALRQAERGDE